MPSASGAGWLGTPPETSGEPWQSRGQPAGHVLAQNNSLRGGERHQAGHEDKKLEKNLLQDAARGWLAALLASPARPPFPLSLPARLLCSPPARGCPRQCTAPPSRLHAGDEFPSASTAADKPQEVPSPFGHDPPARISSWRISQAAGRRTEGGSDAGHASSQPRRGNPCAAGVAWPPGQGSQPRSPPARRHAERAITQR